MFGFQITQQDQWKYDDYLERKETNTLISHVSRILLSRRVRGKAYERLLIDKKHALKRNAPKKEKNKSGKKICVVDLFTEACIPTIASTSSLPFCFIRKFSRRIKKPLSSLLQDAWSVEMIELGIRLLDGKKMVATNAASSTLDREWSPITDVSIANAIQNDSDGGSIRCSFISNEESNEVQYTRSLNVEELAIEEYAAGRLPLDEKDELHKNGRGGWKGWHCEGVHVRVLFRIICSDALLGYCCDDKSFEDQTVFLNPYQVAPLDLQVAHGVVHNTDAFKPIRGFYERRRTKIEAFLSTIESMSPQNLADLVFESVTLRLESAKKHGTRFLNDQTLCKDVQQVKTLSMLAAGFGGYLLASMFRLLSFDYRHYGAGLPDLLLVRAFVNKRLCASSKASDLTGNNELLNLSEWIGEVFQKSPTSTSGILDDRDEEFLRGSISEKYTGASASNRRNKDSENLLTKELHPERLILISNGLPVIVECVFVEVKSHSDKLDDRQEDWLNILDHHENARVCKFHSSKKKKR